MFRGMSLHFVLQGKSIQLERLLGYRLREKPHDAEWHDLYQDEPRIRSWETEAVTTSRVELEEPI